jgi:hypothetical protein
VNLPCLLCDMVAEGRLEWTPTHDRTLWATAGLEKRKQMAAAHGLRPVSERRDTEWIPIRNPVWVPAPTPLELETDWVTWIEQDVPDEPEEEGNDRDPP